MRIGILGTGRVAQALGQRWIKSGREVQFGSRQDQDSRSKALTESCGVPVNVVSQTQCASDSDVLVLATPWPQGRDLARLIPGDRTCIVIDCMNPLSEDLSSLVVPEGSSTAQLLAQDSPHLHVIKAFNCASSGTLANPSYPESTPTMLYCGDDAESKTCVRELIEEIGFDAIDVGDLGMSSHLESLALLTIKMAIHNRWGGDCALKILVREPPSE